MKIAVTADAVLDITDELLEKYDIKVIPTNILFNDKEYKSNEISLPEIFEQVNTTKCALPKTSAMNSFTYSEFFKEVLKDYDCIVHFSLSSKISSMNNNALVSAKEFGDKIEVIDSLSLSTGVALLAIYARELTEKMDDIHEIANLVRERIPYLQVSFVLERLDYMHKGGRCSSIELLGANILKIRPQIIVRDGSMTSHKKYRGPMNICVKKYCEDTLLEFNNPCKHVAFLTYTTATPEMISAALDVLKAAGFENIYITCAGPTIGSHCGDHTLGILYINDGK